MNVFFLNIVGSEWVIIVFVALILILGTNKLPEAARKLGRVVNEFNKAKNDVENEIKDYKNHTVPVNNPVQNERQKLETIAKSLDVNPVGKTTEELREIISSKIGHSEEPTKET